MSPSSDENPKRPAPLVSVFGAAYVAEQHIDRTQIKLAETGEREAGVAGLWLVFYAVLIGVSFATSIGGAGLVELASNILR